MTPVRAFVALLLALLVAVPLSCAAAPFAVQIGDAKIGLDAPPGFSDTSFTGSPRLQELGEALTSASNRVLLFAVTDADLRRFMTGEQLDLRRYMIAVTPRGMEHQRVGDAMFKQFVGDSLRELGAPPAATDFQEYLESRPAGAVNLLAELRKDPDAVSVLQGSRSKGGFFERSQYLLSTTTLMLLRGRALSLAVYTRYDSPADLDWIRATTARWIDELRRLNPR
ncbi:MAG: hypothetical protein K0R40_2168 [Burkholderiales bacterium]|jgi:hypothetical protein|nr:hypothetical protein [Burkholderiales bacterium]